MKDLQFDKADYGTLAPATTTCAACQAPLTREYYDVNGQPVCASCKAAAQQALVARIDAAGLGKALAAGLAGAAVGSALFYVVETISGYRIGLIAIAAGFLVGHGARWGTDGRGGLLAQILAVGLTYSAVAFSYLPAVLEHNAGQIGIGELVPVTLFLLALPVRMGIESPLGLLIVAFGLYEAWRITAAPRLAITGPFQVAPAAPTPLDLPPPPPPPPVPTA